MNKLAKLWIVLGAAGMLLAPALSYAQTTGSAVTTTIGYFYSASGQMVDAEDNNGMMSSYLTRGERYNGTSETFAVSNIKDITADLDSSGNVLNKYTYTAYGTQTSYSSSPTSNIQNQTLSINENPYTYDGYYTDSESGNYYLNARYYDPTLGIFLTSDSYNLPNRYMYVNGNPVMATDPSGHTVMDCIKLSFKRMASALGSTKFHTDTQLGCYHDGNLTMWGSVSAEGRKQTDEYWMHALPNSDRNMYDWKQIKSQIRGTGYRVRFKIFQVSDVDFAIKKYSLSGVAGREVLRRIVRADRQWVGHQDVALRSLLRQVAVAMEKIIVNKNHQTVNEDTVEQTLYYQSLGLLHGYLGKTEHFRFIGQRQDFDDEEELAREMRFALRGVVEENQCTSIFKTNYENFFNIFKKFA